MQPLTPTAPVTVSPWTRALHSLRLVFRPARSLATYSLHFESLRPPTSQPFPEWSRTPRQQRQDVRARLKELAIAAGVCLLVLLLTLLAVGLNSLFC